MNQQTGELIAVKQIPVTDENTEQVWAAGLQHHMFTVPLSTVLYPVALLT